MTIRKHQPWGEPGVLAANGVVVSSDVEASRAVAAARAAGIEPPELGLLGGDLCATMSGTGSEAHLYGPEARRYPVDLGIAVADGVEHVFVAHVLVRRPLWRGRILAAMNAQFLGPWDLGPKSHPNDGLLDVSDARLGFAEKLAARRRAPSGTHVPHPRIEVRRTRARAYRFEPGARLFVDGVAVGGVTELELRVEPDALTVVI